MPADPDFQATARAIYGWEPDEGYTRLPAVPPVEAIAAALRAQYVAGLERAADIAGNTRAKDGRIRRWEAVGDVLAVIRAEAARVGGKGGPKRAR